MDSAQSPTAVGTATAVRSGSVSAREATQHALERIAERDEVLGAFQVVRTDRALAEADALDARADKGSLPLAGVPVAVKDNVSVAGEPMRIGSASTSAEPRTEDHEVVRRLRAAGAVVVGLTRVPELCVFGFTDSVHGVTRNPWDTTRTSGGSSGGSAAAVSAGMVPVAHGNDGMGSIRIPAACTGLVGLKPGLGLVPSQLGNGSWFDMEENGPLATTVADAALMLSVMAGRPELAEVAPPPARVRIALSTKGPSPLTPADAQWVEAARSSGRLLAGAGHDVEAADPPYSSPTAVAALLRWSAGTEMDARLVPDRSRLGRPVSRHALAGRLALHARLVGQRGRAAWHRRLEPFFAAHDVLLTPALAQVPPEAEPAGRRWGEHGWLANVAASARYAPFAAAWNLAGWPAIVVPAGVHPSGLPVAVQLVTRPGGEALLLSLAAQLEQLRPWERLAPAYRESRLSPPSW